MLLDGASELSSKIHSEQATENGEPLIRGQDKTKKNHKTARMTLSEDSIEKVAAEHRCHSAV